MGEVVRLVRASEREQARLIREARAIYESIFPSAGPIRESCKDGPVGGSGRSLSPLPGDGDLS
ncbi:hypothetical protein ACE10Z_05505 [Bradyrhizobium sp. Pha-3]|uniref:hypothetical protein n=1 Tax=Bradyrhizobium sp. Pha-3 TaxID=208375 RepID=UPI0035D4F5A2